MLQTEWRNNGVEGQKKTTQPPNCVCFVHTQCKMPEKYTHFAVCGVEWIAGKLQKSMAKQTREKKQRKHRPEYERKKPIFKRNFNCLHLFRCFFFCFFAHYVYLIPCLLNSFREQIKISKKKTTTRHGSYW